MALTKDDKATAAKGALSELMKAMGGASMDKAKAAKAAGGLKCSECGKPIAKGEAVCKDCAGEDDGETEEE